LAHKSAIAKAVVNGNPSATMALATLENEIEDAAYKATLDLPLKLDDMETHHNNKWRTYRERKSRLEKQRGQAFSMICGQCMRLLLDKMKYNHDYITASESYNPLTLLMLIEKTILAQTEDQYPYATVYKQESLLYLFTQNTLTKDQWYKRFNTQIDVGSAIGVTHQHTVLLGHVAAELGTASFKELTGQQHTEVRGKAEEQYLSSVFLQQSGKQHNKLKVDLKNDFTTGDNQYPKNRQSTFHLLDKYSKTACVNTTTNSEGTAFVQQGDRRQGKGGTRNPTKTTTQSTGWTKNVTTVTRTVIHPLSAHPNSTAAERRRRTTIGLARARLATLANPVPSLSCRSNNRR
jgi:hypothetical protein